MGTASLSARAVARSGASTRREFGRDIGVIGRLRFYTLPRERAAAANSTPRTARQSGGRSALVTLAGRPVAFCPGTAPGTSSAPHVVPYRAKPLGDAHALASSCQVTFVALRAGGVKDRRSHDCLPTGNFVVPDQIADLRTAVRTPTSMRERCRARNVRPTRTARAGGRPRSAAGGAHEAGRSVVVNRPQVLLACESWSSSHTAVVIDDRHARGGLARELALCYTTLALVTDLDAGVESGRGRHRTRRGCQVRANLPKLP